MDQKETTERIKKLNSLINDRVLATQVIDDNTIKLRTDNYTITAVFKDECINLDIQDVLVASIKQFKDYVNNLEDDIFLEACNSLGEKSLSELNSIIENTNTYNECTKFRFDQLSYKFKKLVSEAAYKKIEAMIFKYFPEYREFIKINGIKKINNPKDINELD